MNSIYFKNFMATASVVLASFLMLGMAFVFMGRYFVISDARSNMEANAEEISRAATSLSGGRLDDWDMRMTLSMLSQGTGNHIFLCDAQGYVVSCSDMNLACEHMGRQVPASYRETIRLEGQLRQMTTLADFYRESRMVVGRPIQDDRGVLGYVFVSKDATDIMSAYGTFVYVFFLTSIAVLSIAMIISLLFSKVMAKHLDEMAIAARKYSHGDFSMRVSTDDRTDEMGALMDSFNAMADALEKSERTRQDFIANVSHELKTPMTTIAGFAEGILDGTIPQERERESLQIVVSETRRLSRLVRRMLDLSRLNALTQSTVTAQETFDFTEVMSQVLISLETKITDRQLDVDVRMPKGKLMVWGDPDAVTQVCYNLLDNAAKFAAPGTAITVQIVKKDGKAHTTIRNLGGTIPPEELPLLFERFHKADYSRSMDREGVGLGLYIVKTILGNLKENITVTSEDGVTQFQFTLTLA